MANKVDLTPFGAMFDLAGQAGYGEWQQRQQQLAMQQAQMQQQDVAQQRSLAANLYSQAMQNQAHAWQQGQQNQFNAGLQQAHWANQNQMRQAGYENQLSVANQYGMNTVHAQALDDIRTMEAKGYQYTPFQDKKRQELEDSWDKLSHDPAVNPQQRAAAWNQYLDQKARIVPRQPPPKSRQDMFNESVVKFAHPVTGEEVYGTMGERNGVPTFDPIEFPGAQNQIKQQESQQKLQQQQSQFMLKMQAQATQAELKAKTAQMEADKKRRDAVMDEYYKMKAAVLKTLQTPPPKGEGGLVSPTAMADHRKLMQQHADALQQGFIENSGSEFSAIAPGLAAEMGVGDYGAMVGSYQDDPNATGLRQQDTSGGEPVQPGQAPGPVQQPAAAPQPPEVKQARDAMIEYLKNLPEPQSQEEWAKLPKGTKYIKDGKVYTKG